LPDPNFRGGDIRLYLLLLYLSGLYIRNRGMKAKLISNDSDRVIIFMAGWGCDDSQFSI
jgi:hypothetical protein